MEKENDNFIKLFLVITLITLTCCFIPFINADEECSGQDCPTNITLVIGNEAPTIPFVGDVSAITLNGGTTKDVEVTFNATDNNGYEDLDISTAVVTFSKAGESDRASASCSQVLNTTLTSIINCTVTFQFYDGDGADWSINASISDDAGSPAENITTVATVNELDYVTQDVKSIAWSSVSAGSDDNEADNTITLTNGGNQDYPEFNITGYSATGETNGDMIYASNFSIYNTTGETDSQVYMINDTMVDVSATLTLNSHGADVTEEIFFYVDLDTGLSADTYRSDFDWSILVA